MTGRLIHPTPSAYRYPLIIKHLLHQSLMRCLAREGQPSAVAAAYHRCRASLERHFGTKPSEVTEQIYREACPDTTTRRAHEPALRVVNGHRAGESTPA